MFEDLKAELQRFESSADGLFATLSAQVRALRAELAGLERGLVQPLDALAATAAKVRAEVAGAGGRVRAELRKLEPPRA